MQSITSIDCKCAKCGWKGIVGDLLPDIDGDGSLGCPNCSAIVNVLCDYEPYPDCQIPGLASIYMGAFGYMTRGVFVEIGANDGKSTSNTAFLADIGWTGLYVDPMPELWEQCVKNHAMHPKVSCLAAMIGDGQPVTIMHNHAQGLYTGSPELAKLLHADINRGTVPTIVMDDLLAVYDIPPGFDLLVIDVEGMEREVLAGFTISKWHPKMVIIETHELHKNIAMRFNAQYINNWFASAHYAKIYTDAINSIYIRR